MKTRIRTTWLVRAAALLLVLAIAAVSFRMMSVRAHPVHAASGAVTSTASASASARSAAPIQLKQIWVLGFPVGNDTFPRGRMIELWALFSEVTDMAAGQGTVFTVHPEVYHARYSLLNTAVALTSWGTIGDQEASWQVTIPKTAPLGTYKYRLTLSQPGYPNQTVLFTFQVVK